MRDMASIKRGIQQLWAAKVQTLENEIAELKEKAMDDIQILSKNYYQARENYPCAWADDNHSIKKGRRYVRVVVKPDGADIQTQKVCLDCWMKP